MARRCHRHHQRRRNHQPSTNIKGLLAEEVDLAEFSSFERIEVDGSSVIRGAFKQFHQGGEYAKGRGHEF